MLFGADSHAVYHFEFFLDILLNLDLLFHLIWLIFADVHRVDDFADDLADLGLAVSQPFNFGVQAPDLLLELLDTQPKRLSFIFDREQLAAPLTLEGH